MSFRVECTGLSNVASPEDGMMTVGGTKPDGLPWRLSEADAVSGIERGSWTLHVEGPNAEIVPLVVVSIGGRKRLKARNNSAEPDLLHGLPECSPVAIPRPDASANA